MPRDTDYNPIAKLVGKQKVGQDDANLVALPVLLFLDAAKRGLCPASGFNHLATHLLVAAAIASQSKSQEYHSAAARGYTALLKAGARPTKLLELTTPEYKAIREAVSWYVRSMPNVELGMMVKACAHADRIMGQA